LKDPIEQAEQRSAHRMISIDELWNSYSYGDDEIDEVEAVRKISFQNSIAN